MFPHFHGFRHHPDVQRRGGEDGHGIQLRVLEELAEILVLCRGAIMLHQAIQAVLAQVADRGDLAVGIQMPLEFGAKVSTHHADSHHFVTRRARNYSTGGESSEGRPRFQPRLQFPLKTPDGLGDEEDCYVSLRFLPSLPSIRRNRTTLLYPRSNVLEGIPV